MPALVRVPLAEVEARVRGVLGGRGDVAGAVLFGSVLGACRPDSDIDVGVIRVGALGPGADGDALADLGLAEELADDLGAVGGHPFHVTVLSLRAPFLAFEALHTGQLVYEAREDEVTDFIEAVAIRYREDYPRYRAALREVNS